MTNVTAKTELEQIMKALHGAYAPNTLRAYRSDMAEFMEFAQKIGGKGFPYSSQMVCPHLMKCAQTGIRTSTIKRKAASISAIHRLAGYPDPTKGAEVRLALRKIERRVGNRFKQAYPITRVLLDRLLAVCGHDLCGKRNRALLLLAYDSMRRRSELVSLRVEDMEWLSDEGVSILLRRSKTDQAGTGRWIHLGGEATNAIEDWLEDAAIREGFLIRGVSPRGTVADSLCNSRVGRIYKRLGRLAGLSEAVVKSISGHSMRVGGAQDLLNMGATLPQIMVKGCWAKTDTVMRYVERVHRGTTTLAR
jgi:site-specific recombinase XerD